MKKTLVFRNVHQGAALLEGEALKALAAECAEAVAVCRGWVRPYRLSLKMEAVLRCEYHMYHMLSKMRLQLQKPQRKVAKPSPGRTCGKTDTVHKNHKNV